ncbi:MAG: beta-ketoacyl-[Acidaminococcaceae bacterium]|nr:beta-ketoacyl-[acyl-carrier-protein] synthase II [Acidaminococcaceae bacterium]
MLKRRVVITGLGVVTPIGNDVETFWNNLVAGKSGVDLIQSFDTSELKTKIAGEVKDFDYTRYVDKKEGRKMDRVAHFSVAVAKQAVADAGIDVAQEDPTRLGVCVGTGFGGISTFMEQSLKSGEKGPGRISPIF